MDIETQRLLRRGLPIYTVLAVALLVLTLAAILHLGREIFVPVAFAILLSFVLAPGVRALQRIGLPPWAALAGVVLTALAAFGVLFAVMGLQIAQLGADLPSYQATISDKIGSLSGTSGPGGAIGRLLETFETLGKQIGSLGGTASSEVAPAGEAKPIPVVITDSGSMLALLGTAVSPLLHPIASIVIVLIFVIFVLSAREDLRNRFIRLLGTDDIQHTTVVIDDAVRRLGRLFLTQLAVNSAFGAVIALGLWAIGIPSPFLWGILAGIFRFVPYVGAFVGALLPLALAFAVDPDWSMLVWTLLLFVIIEPLVGHVVEPLLFGHSTGLSPVAVILAAIIWTFLWGPIGLVLATPLTVCLVVLGRHIPALHFLDVMLGDRPALSPPQIFYQRMLAGDPAEAIAQAREFLRERALSTYYDEVALEALRLAHEDIARGQLTPARQDVLRRSTLQLVESLGRSTLDPRPRGGQVGAEAAAAIQAAGPDRGASTDVLAARDLRPDWRGPTPVVCTARPDTLDDVIARMLAQVLSKHGVATRVISTRLSETERDDLRRQSDPASVRLVCLSFLEPLSTLHLRYAVRMARRQFPDGRVVLGIWRQRDPQMARALNRNARADMVAPTLGSALSAVVEAARRRDVSSPAIGDPRRPEAEPAILAAAE